MAAIEDYSLICAQGHRFDLSKKGTLFLIKHGVKSDYDQKKNYGRPSAMFFNTDYLMGPLNRLSTGCLNEI